MRIDPTTVSSITTVGYTGQELIAEANLIQMGARLYDPATGVFLNPDPTVAAPFDSRDWNQYAYVYDNPLRYVDPSGYAAEDWGSITLPGVTATAHYQPCPPGYFGDYWPNCWPAYDSSTTDCLAAANEFNPLCFDLLHESRGLGFADGSTNGIPPASHGSPAANGKKTVGEKIKNFLCAPSKESGTKDVLDNGANTGSAADAAKPLMELGATAAGASKGLQNAQAYSFLGSQAASGLKSVGRIGGVAAGLTVGYDILSGDYQSALYDGIDYAVYTALADFGTAGAPETLGASAGAAAFGMAAYYNAGGSRGMMQSALCR